MTTESKETKNKQSVSGRLQRCVMWAVINGGMVYALYMAMAFQNEFAANIIKFLIWLNFISMAILTCAGGEVKKKLREKGPSVHWKINFAYGLIYSCTLAAFGWFGYATLDILATFLQMALYNDEDPT
ncbi:MAG: hypothetical protein ACYST3_09365 [Planctomycetota bacterium]